MSHYIVKFHTEVPYVQFWGIVIICIYSPDWILCVYLMITVMLGLCTHHSISVHNNIPQGFDYIWKLYTHLFYVSRWRVALKLFLSSLSELAEEVAVELWPPNVLNVTFTTSAAPVNTLTSLDVGINYDSLGSQYHYKYTFPIVQKTGWDLKIWAYCN